MRPLRLRWTIARIRQQSYTGHAVPMGPASEGGSELLHPRVSVICIFYNAERFFEEAIESVLGQDFGSFELLLVDDGSTDGSTTIAPEYAARHPERVRYLEHPGHANLGMSATRNYGIRAAPGELVAFIDSDDKWRPRKLAEQVAVMDIRLSMSSPHRRTPPIAART